MKKRLDIVMKLTNVFDYAEFIAACKYANVPRLSWSEYAQKVLALQYGLALYPDLSPFDAYMEYTKNNNDNLGEPVQLSYLINNGGNGCGSCGGGKVR